MLEGWKTQLIGTSPAPGAIESLVHKLKPDVVLLSVTTAIPFEKDPGMLERLDQFAEKSKGHLFLPWRTRNILSSQL